MISIVIINYNTFELTCNCIRSIVSFTTVPYEIILVDNASTECDPSLFQQAFPFIKLIKNHENSGFAAGNNLGLQYATGEVALLLNSDTYLIEDAIGKTLNQFLQSPNTGVVGCRMIYPDGTIQHTARRYRSISWELLDLFRPVLFLFPYAFRVKLMLGKYFKSDFNTTCDWLNGAFFMFQTSILTQLPQNKLDDRFFMYGEDQLWCLQIKQLGFDNLFYAGASIVHINNASTVPSKQLALKKIMMKHELEIMKLRKGQGVYYLIFKLIFAAKENIRYTLKKILLKYFNKTVR